METQAEPVARREVAEAAETFVRALVAQGVECLFLNPGTDTFPVQEALSKLAQQGEPVPRTVLCLFEVIALAAAHGYYAVSGRPQAVLVHVDVGTQNLGGMMHNAQRGRAAVLVCAGRTPYTTDAAVRGTRDTHIHWLQEQFDQHGIVRNYVKWDYELRRADQMGEVVARGFQIAASDPPGPAYLTLPREIVMAELSSGGGPVGGGPAQPSPAPAVFTRRQVPATRLGAGDPAALEEVAALLVEAERPVVLTATTGRTAAGFRGLVELAELLALPVVERPDRTNFPTTHDLHQGFDPNPFVASADVLLVLDHDVPYIPTQVRPREDATVVQIDLDPVKDRIPLWSFKVDRAIRADTGAALPWIARTAAHHLSDGHKTKLERRRDALAHRHEELRTARDTAADRHRRESPIALPWLCACLGTLHRETREAILIDETITSGRTLWSQLDVDRHGTMFGSGGSALGWGVGAAVGASLAEPDRPVILLVGDGSFVFGDPLAGLWAAQTNDAPFLTVVFNNACYRATKGPLQAAYPDGYSVTGNHYVGVHLTPPPRYDLLGQVVGAAGERVDDPDEVLPALRRGLESVQSGRSFVLDVILAQP